MNTKLHPQRCEGQTLLLCRKSIKESTFLVTQKCASAYPPKDPSINTFNCVNNFHKHRARVTRQSFAKRNCRDKPVTRDVSNPRLKGFPKACHWELLHLLGKGKPGKTSSQRHRFSCLAEGNDAALEVLDFL